MAAVLADIFLMEAYVNEKLKLNNLDSTIAVKNKFYSSIFKHHKVDSSKFYRTLGYFQSNPDEFQVLLKTVDSSLYKITPLDTSRVNIKEKIIIPENIDNLSNFREQEEAMRREYLKNKRPSNMQKDKNGNN